MRVALKPWNQRMTYLSSIHLAVTLYNKRNSDVLMGNLRLEVKTSETSKTYSSDELKRFSGETDTLTFTVAGK